MFIMEQLKINVIAEEFVGEANGVTTAILELIESLKQDSFYDLITIGVLGKKCLQAPPRERPRFIRSIAISIQGL